MMFISKCSFLQKDYNETDFKSRNNHMYYLFSISDMLMMLKCHTYQKLATSLIIIPYIANKLSA